MISKTPAPPAVMCYGRASLSKQVLTEQVQRDRCEAAFAYRQQTGRVPENAIYAGWFYDFATSSTKHWFQRPMGQQMLMQLRRGDTIIVSHLDRAFRSVVDCSNTIDRLEELGVGLVLMDADLDTTSAYGRGVIKVLAVIAEMHRELTRERLRESARHKIANGLPCGNRRPVGWYIDGKKKFAKYKPHYREREICNLICQMRDEQGVTYEKIAIHLRKMGIVHDKQRIAHLSKKHFPHWETSFVQLAYKSAKLGYPLFNRTEIKDAYLKHKRSGLAWPGPELITDVIADHALLSHVPGDLPASTCLCESVPASSVQTE